MRKIILSFALLFPVASADSNPAHINNIDYMAIKAFANCVRNSEEYFPTRDSLYCGVLAQSKSQIMDYLTCPKLKRFKPDRVENLGNIGETLVSYKCSKFNWIEITITKKLGKSVVTSIGESMP